MVVSTLRVRTMGRRMSTASRSRRSPAVTGSAGFQDVSGSDYFAAAVAWAKANDITDGVGNGLFGSKNSCTRAQIVTFLYLSQQA